MNYMSGINQLLLLRCFVAGTAQFTVGILVSWSATALPSIRYLKTNSRGKSITVIRSSLDWTLSEDNERWIVCIIYSGGMAGTIFSIVGTRFIACAR